MRAVVLVEGVSDQRAVEAVASRRGRDLAADGVAVVAMGGATNVGAHLDRYAGWRVVGLVDAGEERVLRRALRRRGHGELDRAGLEALGFFTCEADLEDEMIRALGVDAVVAVVEAEGELASLRTFQRQPAQRGVPPARQLRRFIGTRSGRKIRYGTLLATAAVDADRVPRPIDAVLRRT